MDGLSSIANWVKKLFFVTYYNSFIETLKIHYNEQFRMKLRERSAMQGNQMQLGLTWFCKVNQ